MKRTKSEKLLISLHIIKPQQPIHYNICISIRQGRSIEQNAEARNRCRKKSESLKKVSRYFNGIKDSFFINYAGEKCSMEKINLDIFHIQKFIQNRSET